MNKAERREYSRQWRQNHREIVRERNRKWREAHKEYIRAYNIAYNKSHQEQIRSYKHKYPYNPKKALKLRQREKERLKTEVLTHYGNGKLACVICSENRLACLSIDHIDGGGTRHRQSLGLTGAGNTFYRWLRRHELPEGYQTLCMNCQFIKREKAKESRNQYSQGN